MSKGNILVVEDERLVACDLQQRLQRAGYEVPGLAGSGEEAIRSAERFRPDLILMDVMLPGAMDGIAAAGRIRERLQIPVVFLSSHSDQSVLDRAKATEPMGYILKPYEEQALLTTVDMVLHRHRTSLGRVQDRRAEEGLFRAVFDQAPWGMAVVDKRAKLVRTNAALKRMLGCGPDEFPHRSLPELVWPEDRVAEAAMFEELSEGLRAEYQLEQRNCDRNGQPIWVRSAVVAVPSGESAGNDWFVLRMVQDISKAKEVQERYLRSQRMATIGTVASSMAHNLSNVLSPVLTGLHLLRHKLPEDDAEPVWQAVDSSLRRSVSIVRQILEFGTGLEPRRTFVALGPLLEEVGSLVRELFPRKIVLETQIPLELWTILGNSNQIHQAVLNLCTNAREAMPKGGRLRLDAQNTQVEPERSERHSGAHAGRYVEITVADTGVGMPAEVRERLFEPCFTTPGKGTSSGLGLATTLDIVRTHGGFVEVKSEPGAGTEFRLLFPAAL